MQIWLLQKDKMYCKGYYAQEIWKMDVFDRVLSLSVPKTLHKLWSFTKLFLKTFFLNILINKFSEQKDQTVLYRESLYLMKNVTAQNNL